MFTLSGYTLLLADATEDWWSQQLFGLNEGQRFVLLLVVIGCLTGIIISAIAIISGIVESVHRRRVEGEMKRDMLDRGMSAEEIAQIIESSQPKDFLERLAALKRNKN